MSGLRLFSSPYIFPSVPIFSLPIHIYTMANQAEIVCWNDEWRFERFSTTNKSRKKKKWNQFYGANLFDCVTANYAPGDKAIEMSYIEMRRVQMILSLLRHAGRKYYGMVWYLPAIFFPLRRIFVLFVKNCAWDGNFKRSWLMKSLYRSWGNCLKLNSIWPAPNETEYILLALFIRIPSFRTFAQLGCWIL